MLVKEEKKRLIAIPDLKAELKQKRELLSQLKETEGQVSQERFERMEKDYKEEIEKQEKQLESETTFFQDKKESLKIETLTMKGKLEKAEGELSEIEQLHTSNAISEEKYKQQKNEAIKSLKGFERDLKRLGKDVEQIDYNLTAEGKLSSEGNSAGKFGLDSIKSMTNGKFGLDSIKSMKKINFGLTHYIIGGSVIVIILLFVIINAVVGAGAVKKIEDALEDFTENTEIEIKCEKIKVNPLGSKIVFTDLSISYDGDKSKCEKLTVHGKTESLINLFKNEDGDFNEDILRNLFNVDDKLEVRMVFKECKGSFMDLSFKDERSDLIDVNIVNNKKEISYEFNKKSDKWNVKGNIEFLKKGEDEFEFGKSEIVITDKPEKYNYGVLYHLSYFLSDNIDYSDIEDEENITIQFSGKPEDLDVKITH